jgi:hypothetical protein
MAWKQEIYLGQKFLYNKTKKKFYLFSINENTCWRMPAHIVGDMSIVEILHAGPKVIAWRKYRLPSPARLNRVPLKEWINYLLTAVYRSTTCSGETIVNEPI